MQPGARPSEALKHNNLSYVGNYIGNDAFDLIF